jgi:hypothetical protein
LSIQSGGNGSGQEASTSSLHILRFFLVERAKSKIVGENGNVDPRRRSPVGIVIPLFSAFESVSISVVVLTGVSSVVSVQVLVCQEQSSVAISGFAFLVIGVTFVHSVFVSSSISKSVVSVSIVGDGIGGTSISVSDGNFRVVSVCAHVLNHKVATVSSVSTTVLSGPFYGHE